MPMTARNARCTSTGAPPQVADLLARASGGDPAAWEEIVRRYGDLVRATVRLCRLRDNDALDAVRMTWLRLTENAHRMRYPEQLGVWLVTTAQRECLRILHDRATFASDFHDMDPVADPSAGPEQRVTPSCATNTNAER
jgi:DNA-directed RNA polymerase specialized sigma24 family protein